MRPLGELEAAIMQRLWERDEPAAVRDVIEALRNEREPAYTTVMTVLDNLYRKNTVSRQLAGRAYMYTPAISAAEYSASLIAAAVDSSPDRSAALLHFLDRLSPEDVRRLQVALDEASAEDRVKPKRRRARRDQR